jgi:hypothetical protein
MGWTRGSGTPIVAAAFAWMIAFGIVSATRPVTSAVRAGRAVLPQVRRSDLAAHVGAEAVRALLTSIDE